MPFRWFVRVFDNDVNPLNYHESEHLSFYTGARQIPNLNSRTVLTWATSNPISMGHYFNANSPVLAPWDIEYLKVTAPDSKEYFLTEVENRFTSNITRYSKTLTTFSPIPDGTYTFELMDKSGNYLSQTQSYTYSPFPVISDSSRTPLPNAYLNTNQPTFSWAPIEGGTYQYMIRITDYTLNMRWYESPISPSTTVTLPSWLNLPEGTSYKWLVIVFKSLSPMNFVSLSPAWTFTINLPDSDQDGMDDSWEISYFGDLNQGPDDDPDGDGLTNLEEFHNGTDPNIRQYRLTVARRGTGTGTLTSLPSGIDCGPDCSEWYDSGTEVTLTVISDKGTYFEGWSGGACPDTAECTCVISGNTNIIANFQSKNFFDRWAWHWRNPLPQGNRLTAVAYGNNIFVAVGESDTLLTSGDGQTWTSRFSGTNASLWGVTYGNNTFVAVGSGGTILTSSDGITWTSRSSGTNAWFRGVTYGNNIFVAVGEYDTLLTSGDSQTWTSRSSGTDAWLFGVIYGNNIFVAVGEDGKILQSDSLQPKIFVSPASHDFGSIYLKTTSAMQTFTIDNIGAPDLVINSVSLQGPNPGEFSQGNNCSAISPGGSCSVSAAFNPLSAGAKSTNLVIASNDPGKPAYNIPLSGTGLALAQKGDINLDGLVDLQDAILALQIIAGWQPPGIPHAYVASGADVDGDNKIGMREVIYILQKLAGLRAGGPLGEVPLTVLGNVSSGEGAAGAPGRLEAPLAGYVVKAVEATSGETLAGAVAVTDSTGNFVLSFRLPLWKDNAIIIVAQHPEDNTGATSMRSILPLKAQDLQTLINQGRTTITVGVISPSSEAWVKGVEQSLGVAAGSLGKMAVTVTVTQIITEATK